jgi:type IV fimbrial biogenesis protein FimT
MHQKGFSLIELLAGLVIAATLLQFVGPHFKALIESVRRENAAQILVSGLRNARAEAILRNQTTVIHAVDDNWGQGWRIILDISGKGHEDSDNPLLLERQESGQVTIVGNGPVKTYVRFTGQGEALLPNGAFRSGTVHVCATDRGISHHQVVLAKTGRISLRSEKLEQKLCAEDNASQQRANA